MAGRGGGKNSLYIALVAVLLIIIAVLAFMLLNPGDDGQMVSESKRDPNANLGQYEGKSLAEIQAELDKIVAEGMFNISINTNVTMKNGSEAAELRIENIAANHHLMSVEITRDDTGEVIYTSGLIEPGYYIQAAPLDVTLARGDYEATALFTAYDAETEAAVGQAGAKIRITVEN